MPADNMFRILPKPTRQKCELCEKMKSELSNGICFECFKELHEIVKADLMRLAMEVRT